MVIVSGIVTSRAIFSFGSSRWPVMRWMRRRNEATERSRTSSAESAVTTREAAAALLGAGARRLRRRCRARGDAAAPRACAELPLRRLQAWVAGVAADLSGVAVSAPKRFLATSSALRLVSSSCLRRSSSSRLRASAASRSACSSSSRVCADPRFFFGDLALFRLAQPRVGERVRARAALFLGERAQHDAGRLRRGGRRRGRCRRAATGPWRGNVRFGAGAALRCDRRRRLRLRLARTDAALDLLDHDRLAAAMAEALAHDALFDPPRLSVSVLVEVTLSFSPVFLFVSVIPFISPASVIGAAFPA